MVTITEITQAYSEQDRAYAIAASEGANYTYFFKLQKSDNGGFSLISDNADFSSIEMHKNYNFACWDFACLMEWLEFDKKSIAELTSRLEMCISKFQMDETALSSRSAALRGLTLSDNNNVRSDNNNIDALAVTNEEVGEMVSAPVSEDDEDVLDYAEEQVGLFLTNVNNDMNDFLQRFRSPMQIASVLGLSSCLGTREHEKQD